MHVTIWRTIVATVANAALAISAAHADTAAWKQLRADGSIALVRHADAPGVGDPPGYRLDDCNTQRNLSERGRNHSRALGEAFRANVVPVSKVISSQWCRCLDTATLMALGAVEQVSALNNAFVLNKQRDTLTRDARNVLTSWAGPGALVAVTHGDNIELLTGINPAQGEIVVVRPAADAARKLAVVGRIRVTPM